jgi:hypothetical protein
MTTTLRAPVACLLVGQPEGAATNWTPTWQPARGLPDRHADRGWPVTLNGAAKHQMARIAAASRADRRAAAAPRVGRVARRRWATAGALPGLADGVVASVSLAPMPASATSTARDPIEHVLELQAGQSRVVWPDSSRTNRVGRPGSTWSPSVSSSPAAYSTAATQSDAQVQSGRTLTTYLRRVAQPSR